VCTITAVVRGCRVLCVSNGLEWLNNGKSDIGSKIVACKLWLQAEKDELQT